jgi:MFS family permease
MHKFLHLRGPKNTGWHPRIFVVLAIIYATLIVDITVGNISDNPDIKNFAVSPWGIGLFVSIVTVFVIGQYLLLRSLKISQESQEGFLSKARLSYLLYGSQYALCAIIIAITLQILFTSSYYTTELMAAVALAYGFAALLMGILCYRLFTWFRYNRNIVTLAFAIAALLITMNALISLVLFEERLVAKPSVIITPLSEVVFDIPADPPMSWIVRAQAYTMAGYYISAWVGTILLLVHHMNRVGRPLFGILVGFPLVLFVYFFVRNFPITNPDSEITQALTAIDWQSLLIYTYSIILLGVLIGVGFYSVGRAVSQKTDVRNYMLVAAFGFVIFINAAQATVIQANYPPFSLLNVSFVGLSAFLILLGVYSSAISVSRDAVLRKFIRKSVVERAEFLETIGTSQMQQELENKVMTIAKDKMQDSPEESNTASSLTEDEVRGYIQDVIEQLKSKKE